MSAPIVVRPVERADHAQLVAEVDGRRAGLAHYPFHRSTTRLRDAGRPPPRAR